ncbi:MAG: glycosyl hydrolase family 25 [Hyphomicrobiales bacterium]|nr:glycosyl hydrolase family 25 [Hyphomicrobiales bacterium]
MRAHHRLRLAALAATALAAAAIAGCGGAIDYSAYAAIPRSRDYAIHGVDVSKYQGDIDWNAVRSSGVRFAYIKATEGGNYVDPKFAANWAGAAAAGVPRGAYHFVYWCRPWREEAAWFEANVPVDANALPPVLDVEATPTSRTCHAHIRKGPAVAEMRDLLREFEAHYGKKPIIYTTLDFYRAILADGDLSEYPIWVRSVKYAPKITYPDRHWDMWQYRSDGHVPGIAGRVDRSAFRGDEKQWLAFLTPPTQ